MKSWEVMKLCERQLRDVNPEDVLKGGLYRKCNTYKAGGGYDKFPEIFEKRFHSRLLDYTQFVVQLRGCPNNCPYCYVTDSGVRSGECVRISTQEMVDDFNESGLSVFHLMGGALALYLRDWHELLERLPGNIIFHSDFLCTELPYEDYVLRDLYGFSRQCLFAVSVKGATVSEFKKNTGVFYNEMLFWSNLERLVINKIPFYITFTGMPEYSRHIWMSKCINRFGYDQAYKILEDSFSIDIIEYEALK